MQKYILGFGVLAVIIVFLASSHAGPQAGASKGGPVGQLKNGSYTGSAEDAYYGNVQVKATVSGGKLTGINFVQFPNSHSTSVMINQQAMPQLQQEAISAQSTNVAIVSGATYTSQAFMQSLQSALAQAH